MPKEENVIKKESKRLHFDLKKIPLSGLKEPLENLENIGEIDIDDQDLVDEINETWEKINNGLDSYQIKIRKQ